MKKRYTDFATYLKNIFGCRVQKITVDAGFSCPNRDGTLSATGCLYCNGKGSGSGAAQRGWTIAQQIEHGKSRLASRYKAMKFLAYFQAFTNTHAPVEVLRHRYDQALQDPDVVGLAVGTRPDSIDEQKLDLIASYTASHMVWIEYGLQSASNRTLRAMNRGHTVEDFIRGVRLSQGRDILICAHVILGLPGESVEQVVETARLLAELGIDAVKIHNLYVEWNAPLAEHYRKGDVALLGQEDYVDWVIRFLEYLPPEMVIQRLTGDPDPTSLLAPDWALRKQQTLTLIARNLDYRRTFQGRQCGMPPAAF